MKLTARKKVDKVGRFLVDTLLLCLLLIMLIIPVSTFSIVNYEKDPTEVLSVQDIRKEETEEVSNTNFMPQTNPNYIPTPYDVYEVVETTQSVDIAE